MTSRKHRGNEQMSQSVNLGSAVTKLSKIQRQNVRYDPPVITMGMINQGAESLVNKGYLPKEFDMTNVLQSNANGSPVMHQEPIKIQRGKDIKVDKKIPKKNTRQKKDKVVDHSVIMNVKIGDLETTQTEKTEVDEEY